MDLRMLNKVQYLYFKEQFAIAFSDYFCRDLLVNLVKMDIGVQEAHL